MALKLYIFALHLHPAMLFYSEWESHQIKMSFSLLYLKLLGIFDGWRIKEGKWNKSPNKRLFFFFFRLSLQWAKDFSYCSFYLYIFFLFQQSIRQWVTALRFVSVLKLREYIKRALLCCHHSSLQFSSPRTAAPPHQGGWGDSGLSGPWILIVLCQKEHNTFFIYSEVTNIPQLFL